MSEKILYDSDEAAQRKTLTGWLSKGGHFWPDKDDPKFAEHHARWGGCTHKVCECGNEYEKHWTCCQECRDKKRLERYNDRELLEYSGQPVYSDSFDEYFFREDDIYSYCMDNEVCYDDLCLIVCEPQYAREIDEEYWIDDLPEDTYLDDVAPEISEALAEINKKIRDTKPILSWMPGKYRTTYERQEKAA